MLRKKCISFRKPRVAYTHSDISMLNIYKQQIILCTFPIVNHYLNNYLLIQTNKHQDQGIRPITCSRSAIRRILIILRFSPKGKDLFSISCVEMLFYQNIYYMESNHVVFGTLRVNVIWVAPLIHHVRFSNKQFAN